MITPLDIDNKKFNKQMMNGYNVEEVDEFLDELVVDYEKNCRELDAAKDKIEELNTSLNHYKNIETTLQNTLIMAQTTAEEVKQSAKEQAEQIINEAHQEAENTLTSSNENIKMELQEIQNQIDDKQQELNELKNQFDIYRAEMESILTTQLELISKINKDE